ncbi:unnamed protein product, partial [Thlaspi arvense]
ITLSSNLYCVGINYTSATLAAASTNTIPAITFIMALLFSCIQSAVWAVAMERKASSWKLGWDVNLLSVAYCGIIVSAVAYCLRVWVIEAKGPVFAATFTPFSLIMTAICSAILWKEALHWGSACGALLLVGGLYSVLWGKHREAKAHQIQVKSEETRVETT